MTEPQLLAQIALLPNESILWSGGPGSRASQALLKQAVLSLLLAVALILAFVGTMALFAGSDRASASPASQAHQSAQPGATANPHADLPPWFFPLIFVSMFGMIAGILLLMVAAGSLVLLLRLQGAAYLISTERICIQMGWLTKSLVTIDLDKVISLKATASWLQRRSDLHSIEIIHAGSGSIHPYAWPHMIFANSYTIAYVSLELGLLGQLSNTWLPRDNVRRA